MKRWIGGVLKWTGRTLWACGAALLAVWAIGQIATDRWHWSQYCFWIPTIFAVPGAGLAMSAGLALRSLARKRDEARASPRRRWIATGTAVTLLASCVWIGWQWRIFARPPAASDRTLRVIHWNATSDIGKAWPLRIMDRNPDLIVINPASHQLCRELVSPDRPYGDPLYRHGFTVLSKYRIVRTAYTTLRISLGTGIDPRKDDLVGQHKDHGRALMVELDTTEVFGRRLRVLCLDLPSDVSLHRGVSSAEAARALASYAGPFSVLGEDGVWSQETPSVPGVGAPDLVLGDFNTPRGSRSLERLTEGLGHVYDEAGRGPFGTWPYARPIWHLDHMFIAPWLRGVVYEPLDLGGGTHRGQLADLAVREPS
ncbi:MAG: hypothetical protein HEQ23_16345 [Tepidisphaera sp.]